MDLYLRQEGNQLHIRSLGTEQRTLSISSKKGKQTQVLEPGEKYVLRIE